MMEQENPETRPGRSMSYGRSSSAGSSVKLHSSSQSDVPPHQIKAAIDSEDVSEDRHIDNQEHHSWKKGGSFSVRSTADDQLENSVVFPVTADTLLQPLGVGSRDPTAVNDFPAVSPLAKEVISSASTHPILDSKHIKELSFAKFDQKMVCPSWMEYLTCHVYLAFFGILGVLTRYSLQRVFGPNIIGATSDSNILYLDLPSNMVGSFLMGWWGVVFKREISQVSDYLAIGLSTGYLGSLTTFSGWNQSMLKLSLDGKRLLSILGFLIGLFLAHYSIILGVETAMGFKWLIRDRIHNLGNGCRMNNYRCHLAVMLVLLLMTCFLWAISGTLLEDEFNNSETGPELWLACIVGPFGVWVRWYLACLNGRGLGKSGLLKWVPFGTLIANVAASCINAALATTKKVVKTRTCDIISTGLQFGFPGCLSTVSTFISEFNAMQESKQPWRAYVYAASTIILSFGPGLLIYNLPVWTKGYEH